MLIVRVSFSVSSALVSTMPSSQLEMSSSEVAPSDLPMVRCAASATSLTGGCLRCLTSAGGASGGIGMAALTSALIDAKLERADAELVTHRERHLLLDAHVVDVRAVAAAQIAHRPLSIAAHDGAVTAADRFAAGAQSYIPSLAR